MTKEDIFISIGHNYHNRKFEPFRRYFMKLHGNELSEIMRYLGKKEVKFDPVREK